MTVSEYNEKYASLSMILSDLRKDVTYDIDAEHAIERKRLIEKYELELEKLITDNLPL